MTQAAKLVRQGKSCDIYENSEFPDLMFFHRTDRYSIGDRVFPGKIPYKGLIQNYMTLRWMKLLEEVGIVSNHIVSADARTLFRYGFREDLGIGSTVVAKKCVPIPLECIVRGYYIPESPSWDPYKDGATLCGYDLPDGLRNSEKLETPIYTPSTKAPSGERDINITFEESVEILTDFVLNTFTLSIGAEPEKIAYRIADTVKHLSLKAYNFAHSYCLTKGVILADAKLEFGFMFGPNGEHQIVLIDEVFTPDSSRFWDAHVYDVDRYQPALDKQFLRRHVYWKLGWNFVEVPPKIEDFMLYRASELYLDICQRLFDVDIIKLTTDISWEWHRCKEEYEAEMLAEQCQKEIVGYFGEKL